MAWGYTKNNYLVVKTLPPAPQISNILHHSAGKYNIQDHSTCIYVSLDFVFCLCYCGSRDRHNPGDRVGGVSYTAQSCNFPRHTLYLQKNPNESRDMTTSHILFTRGKFWTGAETPQTPAFPSPTTSQWSSPCHLGSSLRIFSIMAWLAATADWPSMPPSVVVWPFCKASIAWSSLQGQS